MEDAQSVSRSPPKAFRPGLPANRIKVKATAATTSQSGFKRTQTFPQRKQYGQKTA